MGKLVWLVTLMVCCLEGTEELDLFERAFTFPEESKTTHVKIMPKSTQTPINMVTVCLRFSTHLTREYSLFSLALPEQDNSFLLWCEKDGVYSVYVNNQAGISGLKGKPNEWNSLCATWETGGGLTQVWLNGKPSNSVSVSPGYSINGIPSIIVGQDHAFFLNKINRQHCFVFRRLRKTQMANRKEQITVL
ncbi:serum amyloid P-component-like [Hypomesus transpacificus]|uniref:serum amyloid P-component-like n=1 Tax=Hypomesus transpacificus TaxID=137520 RepID=UPI001F084AA7|nr:serum amyloid P-component-like [Hypomesus transpacificus]